MRRASLTLLIVLLAGSALADDRLAGTWALDRERSDDVNQAINETVSKMNVFTRGIARGRLRKTNPAYPNIDIAFTQDDARILAGPGPRIVMPISGTPIRWKRSDGETFTVTGRMQNGSYVQTFDAKDGRRTNVFSMSSDGRMTMSVTVTSPRLSSPLRYKLVYRRASS